jgi:D-3-phosphoglycerate dehydrogenase
VKKKTILVNNLLPEKGLEELYAHFNVIAPKEKKFTKEEIIEHIPECHGLLSSFLIVDKGIIDAGKSLEIISNFGAGYNNVDVNYATERGIMVTNIPDTVTYSTAELTLGLMISLLRRVVEGDRLLRAKDRQAWGGPTHFMGQNLAGKTLGIIGMGRIGLAVARLAQGFGMNIVYQKRTPYPPEIEMQLNIKYMPLGELVQKADVISLHCPLTPETHHLINREILKAMKSTAYLINTARGPVVEENALLEALKGGEIRGAALDVFEFEPKISEELLTLSNVVLTPHIGSSTLETRTDMTKACVKHLIDYFSGQTPTHVVNPSFSKNRNQA